MDLKTILKEFAKKINNIAICKQKFISEKNATSENMNSEEIISLNVREEPKTVRFADTVRSGYSKKERDVFKDFIGRFFSISQMDFQYSFLEMLMLIIDPKKAWAKKYYKKNIPYQTTFFANLFTEVFLTYFPKLSHD